MGEQQRSALMLMAGWLDGWMAEILLSLGMPGGKTGWLVGWMDGWMGIVGYAGILLVSLSVKQNRAEINDDTNKTMAWVSRLVHVVAGQQYNLNRNEK